MEVCLTDATSSDTVRYGMDGIKLAVARSDQWEVVRRECHERSRSRDHRCGDRRWCVVKCDERRHGEDPLRASYSIPSIPTTTNS